MSNINTAYKHWQLNIENDAIAYLTFHKKDAEINTIDIPVLEELLAICERLQGNNTDNAIKPVGLIIQSDQKTGFCAGANIEQFKHLKDDEAIRHLIDEGQRVFKVLSELPFPTVCLIHGFCLGGGLELALACRYRVAILDPKTRLALPEVRLGIQPGWGGSERLPELIGGLKAMDLILSGRSISAKDALTMGVVDASVPLRQGLIAARYFIQKKPKPLHPTWFEKVTNQVWIKKLLSPFLLQRLNRTVNHLHYPAPYKALQHWVDQSGETNVVSELIQHDTARHLIRVFDLQESLKRLAPKKDFCFAHIHVIGAGVMGGDIAAFCALKGFSVTLEDTNKTAIAKALSRATGLFQKQLKADYLVQGALDRLIPDTKGFGIQKADLIIEAIIEKVEAKQALFEKLLKEAKKETVLATNTSTIPLEAFGDNKALQERLIGLHFFNPVARMPLVEVVHTAHSNPQCIEQGMVFVRMLDKLPLPVKSAPGFLVNRILMPYLLEAVRLLESGIPAVAIDKAMRDFGMPMGPIELADTVGLDICLHAAQSLNHYFKVKIPVLLEKQVMEGRLGRKTDQGFYAFKKGKIIRPKLNEQYRLPEDVLDRLILSMLNEAVATLREGVVANADLLDAGMIFGTGFPPFRGGLMCYREEEGESLMRQRLNLLSQRYGERFLPDRGWS